jgi:hypothetical protein
VGARAGLRFDESMVYLECSGEVTASVRYWDGVEDGRSHRAILPGSGWNVARRGSAWPRWSDFILFLFLFSFHLFYCVLLY